MKLKEYLVKDLYEYKVERFRKLWAIKAPSVILRNELKTLRAYKSGNPLIKDIDKFNAEYESIEEHKGKMGRIHLKVKLKDGRIIGIFNGRFSRFAKEWQNTK